MKHSSTKHSTAKHKKKKKPASPGAESLPEVGHLEETITRWTSVLTSGLKKYWKPLTGVVILLVAALAAVQISGTISTGTEEALSRRLFELTSVDAAKDGVAPEIGKLQSLVADARGAALEKAVFKSLVSYATRQADAFAAQAKAREKSSASEEKEPNAPKVDDPGRIAQELRGFAGELARQARERFPDDADDIGKWANQVERRLASENDRSWLPPAREYRLQVPSSEPAGSAEDEKPESGSGKSGAGKSGKSEAGTAETGAGSPAETTEPGGSEAAPGTAAGGLGSISPPESAAPAASKGEG